MYKYLKDYFSPHEHALILLALLGAWFGGSCFTEVKLVGMQGMAFF